MKLKLKIILVAFICFAAGTTFGQFNKIKVDSVLEAANRASRTRTP